MPMTGPLLPPPSSFRPLFIRADSTPTIGTGHIMRCIALAQAWQAHGGEVTFISHCESSALRQRIIEEGFGFVPIDHPHPDPNDLSQTINYVEHLSPSSFNPSPSSVLRPPTPWLVLDGYHFTPDCQKAIRDAGIHLLVIDDMNHLPHYHSDILLNQNIHAPELNYSCDQDTILLLGTRYVLLRREFLKYQDFQRTIPKKAKNILVTLGGADPDNVTLKVIEALNLMGEPDIEVKVVVGPANPHIESLHKVLLPSPFSLLLLPSVSNMPELMAWADLAISGGGSTCWELGFMRVPNMVIILAQNQQLVAACIAKAGMGLNLGWHNNIDPSWMAQEIYNLLLLFEQRTEMVNKAEAKIDGEGVSRVIKQINAASISIRRVTESDCELIWRWANDKETREASFAEHYISWNEHIQWFDSVMKRDDILFYIAENNRKGPVGQLRFELKSKETMVSLSIAPEFRKLGYGLAMLIKGLKTVSKERGINRIVAYVKTDNLASIKLFSKAGFKKMDELIIEGVRAFKMLYDKENIL